LVRYPASNYDALDRFLLDNRRVKSSHDCLYASSTKANCIQTITRLVKNVLKALLSECGALDILDRTKFTCETLSLFRRDGPLLLSLKFLHHLRVIP
jgi:hypothetical protein